MINRSSHPRWRDEHTVRLAVFIWVAALTVVSIRVLIKPYSQSVYPIFALAGQNWRAGEDLYVLHDIRFDYFRYSPIVAASFAPLSLLPDRAGTILWRLMNVVVFCGGLIWWFRAVMAGGTKCQRWLSAQAALLLLLVFPLAIGNINNGQSNALVVGLILATLAAVRETRWNTAGICMAIACLFKVYPIAVGLLLVVLYPRRFGLRLAAALAIGLALPFCFQDLSYVADQYTGWLAHMRSDDRQTWPTVSTYRDLRLILRVWLTPISGTVYVLIQLIVAAAIAAICFLKGRGKGLVAERETLLLLLALACCWMTVFGSATESCTYIFLAPSLGSMLLELRSEHASRWAYGIVVASYALLVFAQIANWFPFGTRIQAYGPQPVAGLVFFAYMLGRALQPERECVNTERVDTLRAA